MNVETSATLNLLALNPQEAPSSYFYAFLMYNQNPL